MKIASSLRVRFLPMLGMLAALAVSVACGGGSLDGSGGGSNNPPPPPPPPSPTIAVAPANVSLHAGETQQFKATITNLSNTAVTWYVGSTAGGNATLGTIDTNGLYHSPASIPGTNPVQVKAVSVAKSSLSASSMVTIKIPAPVISSISPNVIQAPTTVTLTLTGKNFAAGAAVYWGAVRLTTTFVSATQLTATVSQSTPAAAVDVTVLNPDPDSGRSNVMQVRCDPAGQATAAAASRILQQASWGPTPTTLANVQLVGTVRYVDNQFSAAMTTYPAPADGIDVNKLEELFFNYALMRNDQLRQRVAFALSQIMVASANKVDNASAFILWQNMLQKDAFGNYYDLLKDVTLSPVMGNYLDMVNNDKPNPTTGTEPNENYAREVLQLFSIGLHQLNPDGTAQLDGNGDPIPTYDQDTIEGFAHVFTGWTYPTRPGSSARWTNSEYYGGPMVPFDSHHDSGPKELLNGVVLPAGGSAQADLDAALQNIFNHPNVGPFISKQLIQHLVTSNPTPEYIGRVTAVFNNNGSGVRGDLKAVVRAILLDPEARRGDDPTQVQANDGHLKEPILFMLNLLRAMSATSNGDGLPNYASAMKQEPLNPPSVFNYYHPDFPLPGNNNLLGPEFEIFNTSATISRSNFVNDALYRSIGQSLTTDISPYLAVAGNPTQLVDMLGDFMMRGQMSPEMRTAIINAISQIPDNTRRVRAALYLVATSSQFQVER